MKRTIALLLCVALSATTVPVSSQQPAPLRLAIEQARAKVYPALVNISVVSRTFSGGRTVRRRSAGSGTIISAEGHVLTNYHVARDAARLVCTLPTGEQIAADAVGDDPATDISVLQLRLNEREQPAPPLLFAKLGDSDTVNVGDHVVAVGNPLSLSSSMTLGIVSNPRRVFTRGDRIQEFDFGGGNKTGMFTVWIQHDALILPGNSGGPLVNARGEIIGVNTRAGQGYGFAAPSKLVSRVVRQIIAHGEVRRGWLGLTFQPVSKLGRANGALVAAVAADSPAAKAGVVAGDVFVKLGDTPIACRFLEEVPTLYGTIANLAAGRAVKAVLERNGKPLTLTLTVAPMASFVGRQIERLDLGASIQDITPPMARARSYPDTDGVLVTGLRAGKPLEEARPRVQAGDVILKVGGRPTPSIEAFTAALAATEDDEVSVTFRRARELIVTLVNLKDEPRRKPGGELSKPWLGVKAQVVTPKVARALGIKGTKGFRITDVFPGTRAHDAGLRPGDILRALDGDTLDASRPQDARDLQNRIENMTIGVTVTFAVLRDGRTIEIPVELQESPASARDARTAESDVFEFEVRECTFMDRVVKKLKPEHRGVLVTEVTAGGWASVAGLATGSLLMAIEDRPVVDVASFRAVMKDIQEKRPRVVKLFVLRGVKTRFVFIEPEWNRADKRR